MRHLKTTSIAAGIVLLSFAAVTAIDAGEFAKMETLIPPNCHAVAGVQGPEDIELHSDGDTLFISSDARRETPGGRGVLYVYKLRSHRLQRFTSVLPHGFRPHGIDLFTTNAGTLLYVVNHAAAGDTVETFRYVDDELRHVRTIDMNGVTNLNDIAVVSENRFYVTEDHAHAAPWRRFTEDLLRVHTGRVLYYDGATPKTVAADIAYANGIATNIDYTRVYVAAMTGKKILVFKRDSGDGSLALHSEIPLPGAPDNIAIDADRLLVAVHPKLLTLKWHSLRAGSLAPSKILQVKLNATPRPAAEAVYVESGEQLSSASVAVLSARELIIGSVFDDHFLVCPRGSTL